MKKARAMYIPAGGKKAVWGPVDQNVLPEGYPYKEQSEHTITVTMGEKGLVIDRDGISETIPTADISALIVNNDFLRIADPIDQDAFKTMCMNGSPVSKYWDFMVQNGLITDDYVVFEDWVCTYKDGVTDPAGKTWPTAGFYVDVSKFIPGLFEWTEETIHPMAPEFLPAGVGGNDRDYLIDVTVDGDGAFVSETTFADVWAAIEAGKVPVLYLHFVNGTNGTPTDYKSYGCSIAGTFVAFALFVDMANVVLKLDDSGWNLAT